MLQKFLSTWMSHEEWWFNPDHKYDAEITRRFGVLLGKEFDIESLPVLDLCALCIAYDQLPRHVFRGNEKVIRHFLQLSLACLENIPNVESCQGWMLCFLLLPLRHTGIHDNICRATRIIWQKLEKTTDTSLISTYKRFLKASYSHTLAVQELIYDGLDGLDGCGGVGTWKIDKFAHVLEFCGGSMVGDDGHAVLNEMKTMMQKLEVGGYIISLSGGVDSMVLSYVASHVLGRDKCVCVHINYANRTTSKDEEEFVKEWCKFIGLPLYVRTINEIHRPTCMRYDLRDLYETYTRNVRYMCYKNVHTLHWLAEEGSAPHVLMGHNKDDCFENILTNIKSCNKYENLIGMEKDMCVDTIRFLRPFLNISKEDIIAYAKSHGIPYLYDSTPKWSQRGKIRDKIMPVLKEWDAIAIPGFFELSVYMTEVTGIVDMYVQTMLRNVKTRKEKGSDKVVYELGIVPVHDIVWRKIFDNFKLPQPSKKSLRTFLDRLAIWMARGDKIALHAHLSKNIEVHICSLDKCDLFFSSYT